MLTVVDDRLTRRTAWYYPGGMSSTARKTQAAQTVTSVKIPERVKVKVRAAAEDAGTTVHAYLLQVIAEAADRASARRAFVAEAAAAEERILRSGKSIPHAEAVAYLKAKATGKSPPRPKAVPWRK